MIRGKWDGLICLGMLVFLTVAAFENLDISSVDRNINLAAGYPVESIRIKFIANQDDITNFSYLSPLEYDTKISRISFPPSAKDKSSLPYHRSIYIHQQGISYAHYNIRLSSNHHIGDEGQVFIVANYLNRYTNLPKTITMNQDQKLLYQDVKFMVSPYDIQSQTTTYKYAKVLQYQDDGEKKGLGQVVFQQNKAGPFERHTHTVFGVNNIPQVALTSVEKTIQISHWGNVGISESYKIVNTGPSLKGEFSRVTYGSRSGADAKNAFRGIEFDLPYEIWGLYYLDEVGNISTSKAFRQSDRVHVALQPRFALLGGWKSNWQIGYNFRTQGHLSHRGNSFKLHDIKVQYALEKLLTQDYTIRLVLPDGATNVRVSFGGDRYDMNQVQVTTSEGYLDFNGRPTYVIPHFKGQVRGDIEVQYDYSVQAVYEKPLTLAVIVLSFLLLAVATKRVSLRAFEHAKQVKMQ